MGAKIQPLKGPIRAKLPDPEPTATAWASRFFISLKEIGWYEHPANASRIPYAPDLFNPSQHVFGTSEVAGSKSRTKRK